jgi:hypothetical protein
MSIVELKQGISSFFHTSWTETPIHWYGLEFEIEGLSEWIRISIEPTSSANSDISGVGYKQNAIINIEIYCDKENRTFEIYDIISNMLLNKNIGNAYVYRIDIDRKGLLQTTLGDFRILDIGIYLKSF